MRILVIAAHPDDEIIGCGGTIAKYINEGNEVYVCIVGEGSSGRFPLSENNTEEIREEIKKREEGATNAAKLLGVKDVKLFNLPNLMLYTTIQAKINKLLEEYIEIVKPDIILTHTNHDRNLDHVAVHDSTMIAGRDIKKIMAYETVGSSENFKPNLFIDISSTYEIKKKSLNFYGSELRDYPNPRSLEGMEILSKYRGMNVRTNMVEAFELIRSVE